jgi:hypothetical protein
MGLRAVRGRGMDRRVPGDRNTVREFMLLGEPRVVEYNQPGALGLTRLPNFWHGNQRAESQRTPNKKICALA